MTGKSIIYNLFVNIFNIILGYYDKSLLKKSISKTTAFLSKIWKESFLYDFFCVRHEKEVKIETSILYKSSVTIYSPIERIVKNLRYSAEKSFIISACKSFTENLIHVPIRSFGIAAFTMSAIVLALSIFKGTLHYSTSQVLLAMAASVILIFFKSSANNLFAGSYISKLAFNFFDFNIKAKKILNSENSIWIIFGIIFGVCGYFFQPLYFLLTIFGFLGSLLILRYTEVGIFLIVFSAALFPTKIIIGLCLITNISFVFNLILNDKYKVKFDKMDFFVVLIAYMYLIASAFSTDIGSSLPIGFAFIQFIFFYFVLKSASFTKKNLKSVLSLFIFSAFAVAIFGIIQKHAGLFMSNESWVDSDMFEGLIGRVYSTLDNPNMCGEFLMLSLPICFSFLYYNKDFFTKMIVLVIMGAIALCLLYTSSRGAWIATVVAFGVFAALHDRRLLILFVIILLLSPLFLPKSIILRFLSIGNMQDSSSSYRISIWLASIAMIKDNLLLGIGLGFEAFMKIYQKYAYYASYALHSHNLYLQILIDMGILGFIGFVITIFMFFKSIFISIISSKDKELKAILSSLAAAISGFLVHGIVDNTWFNYRLVLVFWIIISISRITVGLVEGEKNSEDIAYNN